VVPRTYRLVPDIICHGLRRFLMYIKTLASKGVFIYITELSIESEVQINTC